LLAKKKRNYGSQERSNELTTVTKSYISNLQVLFLSSPTLAKWWWGFTALAPGSLYTLILGAAAASGVAKPSGEFSW